MLIHKKRPDVGVCTSLGMSNQPLLIEETRGFPTMSVSQAKCSVTNSFYQATAQSRGIHRGTFTKVSPHFGAVWRRHIYYVFWTPRVCARFSVWISPHGCHIDF